MLLPLLLAVQATSPAPDPLGWDDPPTEMIDFLGRRSLCAGVDVDGAERERLRCAALAGEERVWRARRTGDAAALRWLDQPPSDFRMEPRLVATFDGPMPARARSLAQSGVDDRGRPYRLTIDTREDDWRSTRIMAAYDGGPERSFTLDNRAFPLIDLQSLAVGIHALPGRRSLEVRLYYGHARGYCPETNRDDRPQVWISFERTRVRATDMRRDNCQRTYVAVPDAAAR